MGENYVPKKEILDKYSDLLVRFALNSGKGIKKGETVFIQVPECAKPMLIALRRSVLKAGGNPLIQFIPDGISREYYELASDEQIAFFPDKLLRGRIDQIDHLISIISDSDLHELEGIDPKKIMIGQKAFKPYMEWRDEKESAGKFSWTLALYGTKAMADEAGISLEEYWQEIINACYLDIDNPIEKWNEIFSETERVIKKLDSMKIEKLRVIAEDTDLIIGIGNGRKWMGGSGRNIPSFEVFISPDYRMTNGKIRFSEKLYRYGNLIEGVYLEFKDGEVVFARADKGEELLKQMIATDGGAKRVGEFSLTDKRLSRISKFMAETLFDENVGQPNGNTHIALGNAYKDSYPGDASKLSKSDWEDLGYNESAIHTDIVSTSDRKVYAVLPDGNEKLIYEKGIFVI